MAIPENKVNVINSNTATSLFESNVEVDPVEQTSKLLFSSHIQDGEGKAKSLIGRTSLVKSQEADNKDVDNLESAKVASNPLVIDPVSDKKSILFKKYPEYFSGVDKTRSMEKAIEFYALNESKFVFESSCSPEFIKKTKEEILEICHWKSGRELFEKLFECYPNLKYVKHFKNGTSASRQLVQLAPEEQYHYTYINENNEQEFHFSPGWITHVHELIHLHKQAVEPSSQDDICDFNTTLGPEFHNMEEQRVITGLWPPNFDPLNENLFHYLSGTPYRSSHEGVMVCREDQPLTAVDCVNVNAMGSLKKIKCDINASQKITGKNVHVHPLTHACYLNNKKMVDYLIKSGADLKVMDDYGSPLHACINYEKWKGEDSCALMRQLIRSGININCRDHQNLTPLMKASKVNHHDHDAMRVLIEEGADINCKDDSEDTLLMVACRKGLKEQFELLIKGRANIHLQDEAGRTPLIIALDYKNWDIAKRLIVEGADVNHRDRHNRTPSAIAREENAPQDIINDLLSRS